jgi:hypothetical protein
LILFFLFFIIFLYVLICFDIFYIFLICFHILEPGSEMNPVDMNLGITNEVSHEMFVLVLPRVSSRVSGFPVASPCLWGKLENISY